MYPKQLFPLLVVLSREQIRAVAEKAFEQAASKEFTVARGAVVEVEPILPGCTCYPPVHRVTVADEPAQARFYVAAEVLGPVTGARVVVSQGGQVLAEIPLEVKVRRQTLAWACAFAALVAPYLLKYFKLDLDTQLQQDFDLYFRIIHGAVAALAALPWWVLTGLGLAAAGGLWQWFRPREEQIWNVELLSPGGPPQAGPASGWLPEARRHFERQQYAEALRLYEEGLARGDAEPLAYLEAARSAAQRGCLPEAAGFLKKGLGQRPDANLQQMMQYNLGCYAVRMGDLGEGLRRLQEAVRAGYADARRCREDPDWAPVRDLADFKKLLAQMEG
jgi:hypothetical protein